MKNVLGFLVAVFVAFVACGAIVGDAEAARLGGGRSFGMQRQSVSPRPAPQAPGRQIEPAQPNAPKAPAPASAPKRNWLGPLAGLAAGLGLAALFSHLGIGEGMANLLMLALAVMAAVFLVKLLLRRSPSGQPSSPMQYAGTGAPPAASPASTQFPSGAGMPQRTEHIPAGFDSDAFLRVAKLNFVRLQAANDAGNLDDMREFLAPEVYAEIKLQVDERGKAPQQTDVVTLNADLLEVTTEGDRHVASVHFSGMIREEAGAAAAPFSEIWNLTKPADGSRGWMVAGIQQLP